MTILIILAYLLTLNFSIGQSFIANKQVLILISLTVIETAVFSLILAYKTKKQATNKIKNIIVSLVLLLITFTYNSLSLYYSQYGELPTKAMLKQSGNLKAVVPAVMALVQKRHLIISLLMLLTIFMIFILAKKSETNNKVNRKLMPISLFASVLALVFVFINFNNLHQAKASSHGPDNLSSIDFTDTENKTLADKRQKKIKELLNKTKHTNAYTGLGKNRNLIVIQVESLQNTFLNKTYMDQEITPFLNSLSHSPDSFYFNDYMNLTGTGNTLDAEFVSLNSMYGNLEGPSFQKYKNNELYGLIGMAKNKGYRTSYMHGYTGEFYHRDQIFKAVGFDEIYLGENYKQDDLIGMGLADESFFKQNLEIIKKLNDRDQPFFSFMVTLSNHIPYDLPQEKRQIKLSPEDKKSVFGGTLNTHRYTDKALKEFIEGLKEAGIYEDSVIVIYGDHYAMNINTEDQRNAMTKFLGREYNYDDMFNVPLIINIPGSKKGFVCEDIGSQLDLLPTLVNIMGWNDETALLFGRDLLEKYEDENILYPQTHMLKGSYIKKDELFIRSRTVDIKDSTLIDRKSRQVLDNTKALKKIPQAEFEIDFCKYLLDNNLLGKIRQEYIDEEIK